MKLSRLLTKNLVVVLVLALLLGVAAGCADNTGKPAETTVAATAAKTEPAETDPAESVATTAAAPAETTAAPTAPAAADPLNVVALKGPTSLGLLKMIDEQQDRYNVSIQGAPDAVVPMVVSGEADIACVPSNLAAVLYNKTEGNVHVIGVNTLGILHLVEMGDTVQSIADLKGKKVISSGKGAVPEYLFNMVLERNGLKEGDVEIEYVADHQSVLAALSAGDASIAVLPQPFLTVAMNKLEGLRVVADLSEESGIPVVMGVYLATKDAVENKADQLKAFIADAGASVEFVNANPAEAGELSEKYDIIKPAPIAAQAIPHCSIVCITDAAAMEEHLMPFLEAMHGYNPKTVGGKLPGDDFIMDFSK